MRWSLSEYIKEKRMGMKNRNDHNYKIRINLTSFLGGKIVHLDNDDGIPEKGVFIPIERNGLFVNADKKVIATCFANESYTLSEKNMSHYIALQVPRSQLEKLKSMGYEPPKLGGMYPANGFALNQKAINGRSGRVKLEEIE